jgi:hypothetical protein
MARGPNGGRGKTCRLLQPRVKLGYSTTMRHFRQCQKSIRTGKRLDAALGCGSMPNCTNSLKPFYRFKRSMRKWTSGGRRMGSVQRGARQRISLGSSRLALRGFHALPLKRGALSPDLRSKPSLYAFAPAAQFLTKGRCNRLETFRSDTNV